MVVVQSEEKLSSEMKEILDEVGFCYYLVLARLKDIHATLFPGKGILDFARIFSRICVICMCMTCITEICQFLTCIAL